jgi:DNA-directed RNA polymerase subunit H (RpoH/RPB5)
MSITTRTNLILSIYKSRETLLELLAERGFQVDKYVGYSKNEIDTMSKNGTLDMLLTDSSNNEAPTKKVYVKYLLDKTATVQDLENIMEDLYENAEDAYRLGTGLSSPNQEEGQEDEDAIVVITNDDPNPKLKTFLSELWTTRGRFITVISIKRLQFNVLKHELQPRHIDILTGGERADLMAKYNMRSLSEFPEISRFDPLALALFLRPGRVCRLVRNSPTALASEYYRVCV